MHITKTYNFKNGQHFPLFWHHFLVDVCRISITRYHMMNLSVNSLGLFAISHQIIIITSPVKNPQNQDHTHHGKNPKFREKKWYNSSLTKRPSSNNRHFFKNQNSNFQITSFKNSNFYSPDATYFPPDLNTITNLIS